MKNGEPIRPEFVDSIPDRPEKGVLYVSLRNKTMLHLCCCDCGEEVETPLSPAEWSLFYDGEDVSLSPSIGNTGLDCRSHYWIKRGRLEWSDRMSERHVEAVRARDARDFNRLVAGGRDAAVDRKQDPIAVVEVMKPKFGLWAWVKQLFGR